MSDTQALYSELKDDLQAVADPLLEFATQQVAKRGAFLPFGGILARDRQVALHAAATAADLASPEEVLPLVLQGLQAAASTVDAEAAATCEWVKVGVDGAKLGDAVKVHVHHRRGLAVAFYLPAIKPMFRGWQFGELFVQPAIGFVEGWANADAT